MKKEVMLVSILLVSIFLSSCGNQIAGGEKAVDTTTALKQVQTGTQGLQMKFLSNYPPANLYDTTEFFAVAEVWNKGNYDFKPGDCFVSLTGYDKNILRGIYNRQSCVSGSNLQGKKLHNLKGSFNQIEFKSSTIALPPGVNEYNPTLNLVSCYEYKTLATPMVCVENSLYQVTSKQKSCMVRDITGAGGNGGPVGVKYVDVEMAGNKAIFSIDIQNYGTGRIVSPLTSLSNCPDTLKYSDFDKVGYAVSLSGGSLISCKPSDGYVRLNNNQGKILCSFNIGNTQSYQTPLTIKLDYNYMDSLRKSVRIIKTPGYN